eukprot:TRINITY_DN31575_c0_g1_i2.p1 TRINITY_DN31575_c0_g1~~TRINITY_DN31575_c0_g1_i2.p1  ORF type:complete len:147 (-),score=1.35 TRINITY_DN31575_c0_g1_i2:37-477(-)
MRSYGSMFFLRWLRRLLSFCFRRRLLFGDDDSTSVIHFGYNIFLGKSKAWIDSSSSFFGQIIISSITAVKVIVSFEPLCKLEVILIFGFGQSFNLDISFDADFIEGVLKNTIISYELIVIFGFPVDFSDSDFTRMNHIDDLAIDSS